MRAIWYAGLNWRGKPTHVFAYYAAPTAPKTTRLPAMVLVHGGKGTAYAEWVQLWNRRGYAAIAMDLCGCVPERGSESWKRHDAGGPPSWGGFDQIEWPGKDQWTYHAVANVIRAHSLLRSFPEIDPGRIGVTGISWGGYTTCIAAAVDSRFRCAIPVYGCGFLGEESSWVPRFQEMGKEKSDRWLCQWDPSHYLPLINSPMLWVTGTNDSAYHLGPHQKSYRLPRGPRTLCIRVRMAHGHNSGREPSEIYVFADSLFRNGLPLARITEQGRQSRDAWATFHSRVPIRSAELEFTKDRGPWPERNWETRPAQVDAGRRRVTASIPGGVAAYYLNLTDERELVVSTEHAEISV